MDEKWEKLMGDDIVMSLTNNHHLFKHDGGKNEQESIIDSDLVPTVISGANECETGDYILVDFDGYCNNDENKTTTLIDSLTKLDLPSLKVNQPFIQARNWLITLGNGDVLPGVEMAIRFLKLNQCGVVKCHSKYAYGPYGRKGKNNCPDVPPNTNVIFKLIIKSIMPQHDIKAKTNSFKMLLFRSMKNIGNHYYINDWVEPDGGNGKSRALKLYRAISNDGSELLQHLEHGSSDRRQVYYIVVDSLNNITAVHLREKEYRKAKDIATQAIHLDPYNMKALCRAAKAALMIGEFEECKAVLDAAEETTDNMDTDDGFNKTHIQRLKRELIQKKREYKKLEKEIYAQMLSGNKENGKVKDIDTTKLQKKPKPQGKKNATADQPLKFCQEEGITTPFRNLAVYILVTIIAFLAWIMQQRLKV